MKGYSEDRQYFIDLLIKKYVMEEENVLWCLGIWEEDTDYRLCNGDWDLLPPLVKKNEIRFEYNQWANEWSKNSCTIFAAIWMLSDLIDYEFSTKQIKEVDELSYTTTKYPSIRQRGKWWYVKYAVDLVADRYNNSELSKKYWKVAYYRVSKYDNEIIESVVDKLYTIDWNYCPTIQFNQDYLKDGMVDGTEFGVNTNWHSVDVICKEWQRSVKNSYKWRKYNIFWLKNKLSAITNFWPYFYVYTLVKEDNLEEVKRLNEFKSALLVAIEQNSKLRHLTNDKNYQSILHYTNEKHRAKVKDIDRELAKYL